MLTLAKTRRGCRHHFPYVLEVLEYEERLSWHLLPIWLLLLVAPLSCNSLFLLLLLFPIQILNLLFPIGVLAIQNHRHHLQTHSSSAFGMHLTLWPHTTLCWNKLKTTKRKLVSWQSLVPRLVHGLERSSCCLLGPAHERRRG